ncbi:hypothetical protein [Bradyrhizobium sp. 2S1]|uniref:hypothetical protein n=1 Tax=Bradyrhizobium sp. 2S1 TaxID=1404429 RepID=UPI00140B5B50|nr:hypothetical protein [Bradyrhizobium sp. 2S1]MCK7670954.1 hypothetical protein [Bradyrhizobium sp. 2S1]
MASKAGIFLAGVGTTFLILGAGFGSGLVVANSVLGEPASHQARVSSPAPPASGRVILPSTAEAAQPLQVATQQAAATSETTHSSRPQIQPEPIKDVQAPVEKQVAKVDVRKAEVEDRERRKRYAERKAKRLAAERAKRQQQQIEQAEQLQAPIVALGGDAPSRPIVFGND